MGLPEFFFSGFQVPLQLGRFRGPKIIIKRFLCESVVFLLETVVFLLESVDFLLEIDN